MCGEPAQSQKSHKGGKGGPESSAGGAGSGAGCSTRAFGSLSPCPCVSWAGWGQGSARQEHWGPRA